MSSFVDGTKKLQVVKEGWKMSPPRERRTRQQAANCWISCEFLFPWFVPAGDKDHTETNSVFDSIISETTDKQLELNGNSNVKNFDNLGEKSRDLRSCKVLNDNMKFPSSFIDGTQKSKFEKEGNEFT